MQSWQAGRVRFAQLLLAEAALLLVLGTGVAAGWGIRVALSFAVGGWIQVLGNVLLGGVFLRGLPGPAHIGRWIFGETVKWVVMAVIAVGALKMGLASAWALATGFCVATACHGAGLAWMARMIGREPARESRT
ncbi:MAG: hypothetical protein ACYCS1_01360 [Gammaproteobacteria bacterium]